LSKVKWFTVSGSAVQKRMEAKRTGLGLAADGGWHLHISWRLPQEFPTFNDIRRDQSGHRSSIPGNEDRSIGWEGGTIIEHEKRRVRVVSMLRKIMKT
jgi:hypothetical protein